MTSRTTRLARVLQARHFARIGPRVPPTFIGRRKEVIRRRDENVAPTEIEEVRMSHPEAGGR